MEGINSLKPCGSSPLLEIDFGISEEILIILWDDL
jgi:hypothetical protein